MSDELYRPAWAALTTDHAGFAQGTALARRYEPGTLPFMAVPNPGPTALADLATLVPVGEVGALAQPGLPDEVPGFVTERTLPLYQMTCDRPPALPDDPRIVTLGPEDMPDMLALADAAKPGPFSARSGELGRFRGIRQDGRLMAMAGERMRFPGHVEVSGICAHPEARGQGLARLLTAHVTAGIAAGGNRPFLHVLTGNAAAVGLYASLGYEVHHEVAFRLLRRV